MDFPGKIITKNSTAPTPRPVDDKRYTWTGTGSITW